MQLPPLLPMSHSQTYVCGDVTIHPSAVIAPGVLLQAEPHSRIVISAGVCIGMGTILHSYQGTLEVGESANIGTGVLFVGRGKIGANACVGSSTTILNTNVNPQQVLPPGSLIGDTSRQFSESESSSVFFNSTLSSKEETQTSVSNQEGELVDKPVSPVYGRTYVNQLLVKLMPHRQPLNQPQLDD